MNTMRPSLAGSLPTVTDPATGRVYPLIAGGDGDDTAAEQLLARLQSDTDPLTDEELDELEQELLDEFDDVDGETPDIERMEELADQIASVRGVRAERAEAAAADQARAEEIRSQIHAVPDPDDEEATAEDDDVEDDEPVDDDDDEAAPEATAEADDPPVDTVADDATDDDVDEDGEQPQQVAASTRPPLRQAATRRPNAHRPQPRRRQSNPTTIVAAGDIPGVSAGANIPDLQRVGEAFAAKAHAVMGSRGAGGRYPIASFQAEFPDDRTLTQKNAELNEERVEAVLASLTQEAIVAAGGLCAPVDVSYDVDNISTDRRPLRDSLTRFGADRGGIRFIEPPSLADINVDTDGTYASDDDTAVALWTEATDSDPGENVKPVQTIVCGEETEVLVDAITKGLTVGNFNRRFFPEQFRSWWALAGAAHARTAEERLWDRMVSLSTAVTAGELLGAARDILENIGQATAAFRSRHRMSDNAPLRLQAPDWVRDLIREDLVRQMPGDQTMAVTNAQINEWFSVRNVNVTWLPDAGQHFGAQGAAALNRWPDTVELLLYPDGHFLHLDGGTLDLGMEIRDSTLNRTNDVEAFTETFENVAFRGVESLAITLDVVPSGTSSGTTDIDPSTTGS